MLFTHLLSRLMCRNTFVSRNKVVIYHSLIPCFNLMPFLRHPKLIRIAYQIRYVI